MKKQTIDIQEGYPKFCKKCGKKLLLEGAISYKPVTGQPIKLFKGVCKDYKFETDHTIFYSEYDIKNDKATICLNDDAVYTRHELRQHFPNTWARQNQDYIKKYIKYEKHEGGFLL